MDVVLPPPAALDPPEEDPSALADVLSAVTAAAFRLGLLGVHLTGAERAAPGWRGDDAAAAAEQIGTVAALVGAAQAALTGALDRLDRHAHLLDGARSRVAALRIEQEDDYAAAAASAALLRSRSESLGAMPDPAATQLTAGLAEREAARAREHAALLADLRSDALAVAALLTRGSARLGGTGHPGDADRVTAHLAELMPAWGDGELTSRGVALARGLLRPGTAAELGSWARAGAAYAGCTAFADALLATLGPDGFRWLVHVTGAEQLGADDALPRLLAGALGAAAPGGRAGEPVDDVRGARYVDRDDDTGDADLVAVGLGVVLAAGAASGRRGVPLPTVAEWGRQMLGREGRLRETGGAGIAAAVRGTEPGSVRQDPVRQVLRLLASGGDPAPCAALLGDRAVWPVLLARPTGGSPGGDADLRQVVELAGADPGAAGAAAVRAGLETLGAGLADGEPDGWPAEPASAAALALPLADGLARHVEVVAGLLRRAGDGLSLGGSQDAALRGLGLVSLDPGGVALLERSLAEWAARPPGAGAEPARPLAGATVLGAFVAVREYGQRLAYALHGFGERDSARSRQGVFAGTVGLLQFLPGPAGEAAGVALPFVAHGLHADGTWDNGADRGPVLGSEDAAALALAGLGPGGGVAVAARARTAFARTAAALGVPRPPTSPAWTPEQAAIDALPFPDVRQILGLEPLELRALLRRLLRRPAGMDP